LSSGRGRRALRDLTHSLPPVVAAIAVWRLSKGKSDSRATSFFSKQQEHRFPERDEILAKL
jgi:hypothetical protein